MLNQNKLILLFLDFLLVRCQKFPLSYPLEINAHGWATWDVYQNLFYFKEGNRFVCDISNGQCTIKPEQFTSDIYITCNYKLLSIDYAENKFWNADMNKFVYLPLNAVKDFNGLYCSSKYYYLRYMDDNVGFRLYSFGFWSLPNPTIENSGLNFLPELKSKIFITSEALYLSYQSNDRIWLSKKSLDGMSSIWESYIPSCAFDSKVYVAACSPYVQALCGNLITQFSPTDGSIILQYSTLEGEVIAMSCSPNYVFLLYNDTRIVQFSSESDYITSYYISGKIVPRYYKLQINAPYIFTMLCEYSPGPGCLNAAVYQWKIVETFNETAITCDKNPKSAFNGKLRLTRNDSKTYQAYVRHILSENNVPAQNSYFNAHALHSKASSFNFFYFSGGGNIKRATCGDLFLHETEIAFQGISYQVVKMTSKYVIPYPISNYASIVISSFERHYFLLHGGTSCDFLKMYNNIFLIELFESGVSFKIEQKKGIE
jgi:hypothetical protein